MVQLKATQISVPEQSLLVRQFPGKQSPLGVLQRRLAVGLVLHSVSVVQGAQKLFLQTVPGQSLLSLQLPGVQAPLRQMRPAPHWLSSEQGEQKRLRQI